MIFLANISDPLFYIGVTLAVLSVVWLVIHFFKSSRYRVTDDDWIISQQRIKQAISGALLGAVLITVGHGVNGIDEPYVRTVFKDRVVEKNVMPTYIQLLSECYQDVGIENVQSGSSKRVRLVETCQTMANKQMLTLKEGPIRVVERPKVTYKQLPFNKFMEQCGAKSRAVGEEGLQMLDRIHDRCLKASETYMRGLVEKANTE